MLRSFLPRGVLVATATVAPLVAAPAPAHAVTLGVATWNAYLEGGHSECLQVARTTVGCTHEYRSSMVDARGRPVQTCSAPGMSTLGDLYVSTCAAVLTGTSSGAGVVTGNGAAVCNTVGANTFTFSIETLAGTYDMNVRYVENNEVSTPIHQVQRVDTGLVQVLNGVYTAGCGGRPGEFSGTWMLTAG